MTEEYKQSIYRYFRLQIASYLATRLICNPCDINIRLLEMFMDMSDDDFRDFLIESVYKHDVKNKEKRETGIEPLP